MCYTFCTLRIWLFMFSLALDHRCTFTITVHPFESAIHHISRTAAIGHRTQLPLQPLGRQANFADESI